MAEHLANHDEPPDRDDGWQDLAVANPAFLLVILGCESCVVDVIRRSCCVSSECVISGASLLSSVSPGQRALEGAAFLAGPGSGRTPFLSSSVGGLLRQLPGTDSGAASDGSGVADSVMRRRRRRASRSRRVSRSCSAVAAATVAGSKVAERDGELLSERRDFRA